MKGPLHNKMASAAAPANLALAVIGAALALGVAEMLLRANPQWVPQTIRVNPPVRRVRAYVDETYEIRLSDGDLFHLMRGALAPLSPEEDRVVARVHMVTDAYGFRNEPPKRETYGIVALGDSFTRASGVAAPWPRRLAEAAGSDVFNLADVGFGPQEELEVLREYGLAKRPQWVVWAYFEGNDLYDAAAYEQANPFLLARFGKYVLTEGLAALQQGRTGGDEPAPAPSYRYPVTIATGDARLEMAFFSYYLSWLSVSRETIESSHNYRLATDVILEARGLSEAAGARFLLVYVPTKAHVYLPYVQDAETLARVFADVPALELDEARYLQFTDQLVTPEITRRHMDDQAHLLSEFAAEQNISFLDLTPAFQEEAGAGVELYYPFDTHWNQAGHDVAAQLIAEYVEEMVMFIVR